MKTTEENTVRVIAEEEQELYHARLVERDGEYFIEELGQVEDAETLEIIPRWKQKEKVPASCDRSAKAYFAFRIEEENFAQIRSQPLEASAGVYEARGNLGGWYADIINTQSGEYLGACSREALPVIEELAGRDWAGMETSQRTAAEKSIVMSMGMEEEA